MISPDALRARFRGTVLPEDPLDVMMPPGLRRWPHAMREKLAGPLRPAGVLVPIMERPEGLSVLLTQRAADGDRVVGAFDLLAVLAACAVRTFERTDMFIPI